MNYSTRYILEVWVSIIVILGGIAATAYSVPKSLATERLVLQVMKKGR